MTGFRLLWLNRHLAAVTRSQQSLEIGQDISALVLGRLMATLAVRLEDRPDVLVKTDGLLRINRHVGGLHQAPGNEHGNASEDQ